MRTDEDIRLPERWQEWKITDTIGQGSYGSVYRAVCLPGTDKEKEAAVKIIHIPYDEKEAAAVAREYPDLIERETYYQAVVDSIMSEIRTMQTLQDNPNVIALEDFYVEKVSSVLHWKIFIRMELLTPFIEYEVMEVMEEADVMRLGADICNILQECSKHGIIHRDIKPENICVDAENRFKLGDFGIARKLSQTTKGMSLKGSYDYMAPEIYHGEIYDTRVDQYSLGIVLYRLMNNNRCPFIPTDAQMVYPKEREAALKKRMAGEVLPEPVNASKEFGKIIRKACAYRPEERFNDISDLKSAIENCMQGTVVEIPEPSTISEKERIDRTRRKKRIRKIILAAAAAAITAAVVIPVLYSRIHKTPEQIYLEESFAAENEIEQNGIRKDNALDRIDISEVTALQDSYNNGSRDSSDIVAAIEGYEAEAKEQNADGRKDLDSLDIRIVYHNDTSALGLSVNYKGYRDNAANTENVQSLFTLYYLKRTNGDWIRYPNEDIPEEIWNSVYGSYLPENFFKAYMEERNCICYPESWWTGTGAVYDSDMTLRTAAVWQNEDGSAEVYMICRNGTDVTGAEYAWWLNLTEENLGDILKAWGHLEPDKVIVSAGECAGYIIRFTTDEVLTGSAVWNNMLLSCYSAGSNSNFDHSS